MLVNDGERLVSDDKWLKVNGLFMSLVILLTVGRYN